MTLRINWVLGLSVAAAMALSLGACAGDDTGDDDGLRVVTSTGLLADVVSNVAGDLATVDSVIPAGSDPHTFSLTPSDARSVSGSDVVFLVGAHFAAAEDDIRDLAEGTVVTFADALQLVPFDAADPDALDPHFWLDPRLVMGATEVIEDALVAADPANESTYRANGEAYRHALAELDEELAATFGTGGGGDRPVLVTFHDAYNYLARAYDLTILGFLVEGPEEEPSAADIADLVETMKREGATVVYKEPQFDARVVQQVASDAGAEVRELPSETLTDDYPTYLDLMRAIAEAIVE